MPIYEFRCHKCGIVFEKLLPIKDADKLVICEHCLSNEVRRIPSLVSSNSTRNLANSQGNSCSECSSHSCASCKR